MAEPGAAMEAEIREVPQAIVSATRAAADAAVPRPSGVVLFARGSSDHAALYGRYVIEALAGVPVMLGAPSLATAYRAPTDLRGWLAIGVSQSGETREIAECLSWASERGAAPAAITNAPDSPLAQNADVAIDLGCGMERAVVATKSFVAECAALAAIGYGWSSREPDWERVRETGERILGVAADRALTDAIVEADFMAVLGRGFRFPLALEIALKIMEACGRWAAGMSWADLLHGPIAALPRGSTCLLLNESGPLSNSEQRVLSRLAEGGVHPYVLGTSAAEEVEEPLRPLLDALPAQLAVLAASRRLGLNPDSPAGLTKVTQS
jgi:glucosamine--fructose-6-phosphate aminotransferase (isomerizing)